MRDETVRRNAEALRARFVERVITATDEERRRLARELHDEAGQSLVSLSVGLKAIESAPSLEVAAERARMLATLAEQTADEIGRIARGLHPAALEAFGFVRAVERLAWELETIHGLRVDLHVTGLEGDDRLPERIEWTLYRVVQEALANVVRHARAELVSVVVERLDDEVRVLVEDDGIGFDAQEGGEAGPVTGGTGLQGIRERMRFVGGRLTLESAPGEGTTLRVVVPLEDGGSGD